MKRFEATDTSHNMDQSFGFFQNAKSGSNYVRFLIYTTTDANDSIKLQYSTDPTGAWTDSDYDDPEALASDGHVLIYGDLPAAIRTIGARVHFVVHRYIAGNNRVLTYGYSDDDGVTWTIDNAEGAEDGVGMNDGTDMLDVFLLGAVPYGILVTGDPGVEIYDLRDFSLVDAVGGKTYGPGDIDGTDYIFIELKNDVTPKVIIFDGTNITTLEDTGFSNVGDIGGSIILKKGNLQFIILAAFGGGNDVVIMRYGSDDWVRVDYGAGGYDLHITWEEDRYEPRFLHISGDVDDIYYFTNGGYMVKIEKNATETSTSGVGQFLHPYEIEPTAYNPANRVPISGGKYRAQSCELLHIGTDYQKGDGIVLTDDSDNIKFIGVIDPKKGITAVGTTLQRIFFVSPGKFDLEEKVSYEFLTKTIPEMRTEDFLNTRYYYEGTIDANATTYDYSANQIPRAQFWKELDELGLKRTNKSNELGEVSMEDADVSSGVTVTHLNMTKKPQIQPQGAGFNRVWVIGGNKPDGTGLAMAFYDIPTSTDQQINSIIFVHPNRKTDVLCLADAKLIGDNVSTSLQSFNGSFIGQGKPLEGTVVNIAYAPDGLSATNFIVESYTYELLTDIFIMDGLSALHWKGKDLNQLLEGTRAALNQLAIDVGNIIEGGTIWYLDDTNSDIGGYESLNIVYDGAAEATYSVAAAADGAAIEEFATVSGEPGITELLDGIYSTHIHAKQTAGTKDASIYFEMYKRAAGGAEVLLATSHVTTLLTVVEQQLSTHVHLPDTTILSTDRIVVKYFVTVTGLGTQPSIEMYAQGTSTSRFQFPFVLTGGAQPFVLKAGDTMTGDLAIDKSGSTGAGQLTITSGAAAADDVNLILSAQDDSRLFLQEDGNNRGGLFYDSGANLVKLKTYVAGEPIIFEIESAEKWRITANELLPVGNKTENIGTAAVAVDTIWADDFTNVASERKYTVPSDDQIYEEIKNGIEPYIKEIKVKEWESIILEKVYSHDEIIDGKKKLVFVEVEKTIINREVVLLDYLAQKDEVIETHHTRSHSHNMDYLNGVIRKLIVEIEDLKKRLG